MAQQDQNRKRSYFESYTYVTYTPKYIHTFGYRSSRKSQQNHISFIIILSCGIEEAVLLPVYLPSYVSSIYFDDDIVLRVK